MKITAPDISMLTGIAAVTIGAGLQFGVPWGLIACGALLIGMTLLSMAFAR